VTWQAVARKDFQDAIRSYWLWGLSALFVVVLALVPALIIVDLIQIGEPGGGSELTTNQVFLPLLQETMTVLVPIIAIVVAYRAVAGERDSGTLKLLLSLPHSRLDVVVGKVVGRSSVVVAPILAGFAVAAILFLATPIGLDLGNYLLLGALTAVLGVVFVAIAVGISAAARTARRAMIGTVGIYVLFGLLWNQLTQGVVRLLRDQTEIAAEVRVPLHLFLKILNPTQAYKTLVVAIDTPAEVPVGENATIPHGVAARVQLVGGPGIRGQFTRQTYAQALGDSVPFYLSDPAVVVVLLVWIVGAPLLGYYAFADADL